MLNSKRVLFTSLVLFLVLVATLPAQNPVPTSVRTDFDPQRHMLPVPTDKDCSGATTLALIHFGSGELGALGSKIIAEKDKKTPGDGARYLREVLEITQHRFMLAYSERPLYEDYISAGPSERGQPPELFTRMLPKTGHVGQPLAVRINALGFKVPHQMIAHRAELKGGKYVFDIADPAAPADLKRTLVYNPVDRSWIFNYAGTSKRLTSASVFWDSHLNRPVPDRHRDYCDTILEGLRAVPPWTAAEIRRRTGVDRPPTELAAFNADLTAYERDVAEHNRKAQLFAGAADTFANRQRIHVSYADKFNAAARNYNSLAPADRTEAEASRLGSIRETVARVAGEITQHHGELAAQRDGLNTVKKSLDARRATLLTTAARLQREGVNPTTANAPAALDALRSVALESIASPRPAQHPIVGSWTITSGFSSGQTLTFEPGGSFVANFPAQGSWRSTGLNSAEATLTYDTPGLAFTCIYRVTVNNGRGDVSWNCNATRGRVDPPGGTFGISKR